jgi:coenzyme F420-reducing hydrogenase alpha subunit
MHAIGQGLKMQTITFEPLPWQERPSRITMHANDSHLSVYYQVTSPRSLEAICCGRPVEEIPRMVSTLAPAHHLTAAMALDRLFQVDPPDLAKNMRTALLQAQYITAHLRKFFFLMTTVQDPLAHFRSTGGSMAQPRQSKRIVETIMRHAALSQEAEDILGGRHDHPLTAVTGGVSRFLKPGHYERLTDISDSLLPFACELADLLRCQLLSDGGIFSQLNHIDIPALAALHGVSEEKVELAPADGSDPQAFNAGQLGDIIALQQETWTFEPFAYVKDKGWQGVEQSEGLFYVGPLARFNAGRKAAAPMAEEQRGRMMELVGTPPVFTVAAAFCAMAVELIEAAETLKRLSTPEKLAGPALRTIPDTKADTKTDSTWASLETPQGVSWHHYRVDKNGIVQTATIIDAHTANNAFKCQLADQLVRQALKRKEKPDTIKEKAAVALLPF